MLMVYTTIYVPEVASMFTFCYDCSPYGHGFWNIYGVIRALRRDLILYMKSIGFYR